MSDPSARRPRPKTRSVRSMAGTLTGLCDLLGAMPAEVWVVDPDGRVLCPLPARRTDSTAEAQRLNDRSIDDWLDALDAARARSLIAKLQAGSGSERFEYAINISGAKHWFEADIAPIPSLPGHSLWLARDITADKAEREHQRLQSRAADAASNAIVITDAEGSIVWVNGAFCALTGYSLEQAIGRNPRDLVHSGRQDLAFYRELWRTITSGQPWRGELVNRRQDGTLYHEYQTITPLRDESGRISHFIAVKEDRSEYQRSTEQLQLLATALEVAGSGVIITDSEGRILWVNPAYTRISGYALSEAVGNTPGDLVDSGRAPPEHFEAFWQTLRAGRVWQGEMLNRRKNGELYTEALTITPVFVDDGKIGHYVAITKDISEEKRHRTLQTGERHLLEGLARGDPLADLLDLMVRALQDAFPGMLCSVLLLDEQRRHLYLGAAPDLPAEYNAAVDGLTIGVGVGSCGTAAATGAIVIASDIASDPNWVEWRELAARHRLAACWSLPIKAGDGRVLGTFAAYFGEPRSPGEDEIANLQRAADLTGLVLERSVTRRRLQASEQRFTLALSAAGVGVFSYQIANQALYCSPLLKRLLGYAEDDREPSLSDWAERIHPDDQGRLQRLIEGRVSSSDPNYAGEHYLLHGDGTWHWFQVRAALQIDAEHRPLAWVGTAEDITERKQIGEIHHFLSQHGVTSSSSEFFGDLAQFLSELLAMEEVLIGRFSADDDRVQAEAYCREGKLLGAVDYALQGTPCAGLREQPVCCFPSGVCELFPQDSLLRSLPASSYLGVALRDSRGSLIGLIAAIGRRPLAAPEQSTRLLLQAASRCADLLERQLLDERLAASERTFRTLFEESSDSVLLLKEGRFIDCNAATLELLGYTEKAELLDKAPAELSPERQQDGRDSEEKAGAMIATALQQGRHRFEWDHLRADGSIVPVEVSLTRLRIGGETLLHTAWRDISARRRSEAALNRALLDLRQRNQALQDFAFVASHDLQEPLRKIRTFTDLLLSRPLDHLDPQARDYLGRCNQAASRMQALIEDLLALSRLGAQPLALVEVALDPLVDQVLSDLEARIEASQAHIERDPLPVVEGDPTLLYQLLQNLLANALKFHEPGSPPQVRIRVAPAEIASEVLAGQAAGPASGTVAAVQIRIEDQGIGFDPAEAERIFAPFRRLHGRDRFEGTGMGLAIVKRIVEVHRGQISASASPGQGACFQVLLPLRQS